MIIKVAQRDAGPNSEVAAAAALLLFVVAIVAVTLLLLLLRLSTNNYYAIAASLHRMARFVVIVGSVVAILARDAFRWIVRVMTAQARNVVSDILTFPSHLQRRIQSFQQKKKKKKRDGDDNVETGGVDVCYLLLDGFHSLLSPHSESQNNDENSISFFDFREGPPRQLQVQDLRRPPNRVLPSDFPSNHTTAWTQFHAEANWPWLWLHTKILGFLLVGFGSGIVDLFRFCIRLLLGGSSGKPFSLLPMLSWRFVIGYGISYLFWVTLFHYWFHAFSRCTSRVCARWDVYFQEQGYSVEFCTNNTEGEATSMSWSDMFLIPLVREGKCYLRFRRRSSAHEGVGTELPFQS